MRESARIPLIQTIRERCRVCYTCVRECPAKAIRIVDGQADVIPERCIGCGNCVRVCGQHAKEVYDSTGEAWRLLESGDPVAAVIAPSFPAEFVDWNFRALTGVVRALGFDYVVEVAAGADLVADRYRRLLEEANGRQYIATSCPAVVAYVERYFPDLVDSLAPIVSPMVAVARMLHRVHGPGLKIVFIGPCIAKKGEILSSDIPNEVDAALTFVELRHMIRERDFSRHNVEPSVFDPPLAGPGALFPISRGLLQAADLAEDLASTNVLVAEGRSGFVEAIKEFYAGHCNPNLLEILACEGCIMGPGVGNTDPLFRRRSRVSNYVRHRLDQLDWTAWRAQVDAFADLDLSRSFSADDRRSPDPSDAELREMLARMGKHSPEDELNCGACGYDSCREHAVAIFKGLAESEMCLPYTIDRLRETIANLAVSNDKLARTQEILMQAEKLASMGQLAAGIAHELNNPLGVVLMYAHLLLDEYGKHQEMTQDLKMITAQADRCKRIVSGLLHFARQNKVSLAETDVCDLVDTCLRLVTVPGKVAVQVEHAAADPVAEMDRDQMTQVLTNLFGNAFHAMPEGGCLSVRTEDDAEEVRFVIQDTGPGIAEGHRKKIFEPFFTTKAIGEGTGMGLAVTYGIVKMHRGNVRVESNTDPESGPTGTTFIVSLPRHGGMPGGKNEMEMGEESAEFIA